MTGREATVTSFAERTLKHRIAAEEVDRRFRRRFIWQVVVASVVLLGLGVLAYRSYYPADDPIDQLSVAVDELRTQVRELGATPVAPPAEDITGDETQLVPLPGPEGPAGDRGPAGPPGAACQPRNPNCVGPPGPMGPRGEQGLEGVGGEPGTAGEPGATGEPGPAGPAGATGPEGPAGPAGATGPAGVSVVDVRVVEVAQHDCHLIVSLSDGSQIDAGNVDCPEPPLIPLP